MDCQLGPRPAECGPNALPGPIQGLPKMPLTLHTAADSRLQTRMRSMGRGRSRTRTKESKYTEHVGPLFEYLAMDWDRARSKRRRTPPYVCRPTLSCICHYLAVVGKTLDTLYKEGTGALESRDRLMFLFLFQQAVDRRGIVCLSGQSVCMRAAIRRDRGPHLGGDGTMYNGHVVSYVFRDWTRAFQLEPCRRRHRSCPSPARPVAKPRSSRRICSIHPAVQVRHLAVEAPRKHQSPLVTKLLFCLPTMTSLRPKEPCYPRNRPAVLPKESQRHLRRHRFSLSMCSKYRRTTRASRRSPPREKRPNRPGRQTRISNAPSRSYRRSVLRLVSLFVRPVSILNDPSGTQTIRTTTCINLSGGRRTQT